MSDPNQGVEAAFLRLAQAVQTGDVDLYRSVARDARDAFQMQLFERNSAMLKKGGMRMLLQRVEVHGIEASAYFDIVSPTGGNVEDGEMTFVLHEGQWLLEEL